MTAEVSHGRGGAGNIDKDDTKYVDGEVIRTGPEGSHHDGPFSTGRGGTGNIGDAHSRPSLERADKQIVPEAAVRPSTDLADYHTGRGGAGNEHLSPAKEEAAPAAAAAAAPAAAATAPAASSPNVSLADKLKKKIFGIFKK